MQTQDFNHLIIEALDNLAEIKRYQALLTIDHANRNQETLELLVESFLILSQSSFDGLELALRKAKRQLPQQSNKMNGNDCSSR